MTKSKHKSNASNKYLSSKFLGLFQNKIHEKFSDNFLGYMMFWVFFNFCRKPAKKRNPILIHLNLCIALALGLIVFVSGIETAVDNEVSLAKIINTRTNHMYYMHCLGGLQGCSSTLTIFIHVRFRLDVVWRSNALYDADHCVWQ